jgi:large subunit ribosomal protein L6
MSRIGKKPVPLPKGVTAKIEGQTVTVKGPKGELSITLVNDVTVKQGDDGIEVAPRDDSKRSRWKSPAWAIARR